MKPINLLCRRKLASSWLLSCVFLSGIAQAETTDTRPYKVSVLIFKHIPADKNTSAQMIARWSEKTFSDSTLIANSSYDPTQPYLNTSQNSYDVLLPAQQSALVGSYRALSQDSHYLVLYHGAWITQFEYGKPSVFHLHKTFSENGNILDGLLTITMKFYFDIHFQTQLLTPDSTSFYHIDALDEVYQSPSNQLEYIDGPIYSALVLITHYDGNS